MAHSHVARTRDVYANLLRDTRGLRRDQAGARETWFASLPWARKEEALFELEMLLKGIACFANPRNHPGRPRRTPAVAHDFLEDLRIVRLGLAQIASLARQLLGQRDRAFTFSRYLVSVLPEDAERGRLIQEQLTQDTPEQSLFVLRNAFASFLDLSDGLIRLEHVPSRAYQALQGMITREVGRNVYFNPLVALEFRPEFDRIRHPEVLESLSTLESDSAHRVVAMTMLSLFRALRYVALIDQYAADPAACKRAYLILAVLRSDLRTLTRFLEKRAAHVMAEGFERELLTMRAPALSANHEHLARMTASLVSLRGTLGTLANSLRVEVRKAFEYSIPGPDPAVDSKQLGPQLVVAAAQLRATLHHAIRSLCAELRPAQVPPELSSEQDARIVASERLRRDVWMFMQILRAFLAKAQAASGTSDRWASAATFQFVREFLVHFRAIGYQLMRQSDYDRLDPFLNALEALRDVDLLDPNELKSAVAECQACFTYLDNLFNQVSRRAELREVPFDRKAAAATLKIYLEAA